MLCAGFFQDLWGSINSTLFRDNRWLQYLIGLGNTILMSLGALLIGVVIGIIMALVLYLNKKTGRFKAGKVVCNIIITIFRGTPVVLQLMIAAYVILSFMLNLFGGILVAMIAFGINSGAYVCEIFRGGLESIEDGQLEAGKSLGFNMFFIMRYIILPQAVKKALPPLGNEFIALIKETSIVGYIGITDLAKVAREITAVTFEVFMPLIVSALIYLALVVLLTWALRKLERKLSKSDREGGQTYARKKTRRKTTQEHL